MKYNQNVDVEFDKEMNDPEVYKLWAEGNTCGIFQFESGGMTAFMKELKPDCLEDLVAGVSLYRPGPMDQIPRYIRGKNNPEKTEYTHPALKPILNVTYGCMVYQEQVMQIVRDIGGYSLGRADLVRRAMGKKKLDVMAQERKNFIYGVEDEHGNVVIPGAIRNGVDEASANKIFDEMSEFAKYAFNKSHAACYAVVAYRTAYLKAHYPVEFMAALLNSFLGSANKIPEYINECKRMNIEVKRPDINKSYSKFTVDGDHIIFGLAAIKNVGEGAVDAITSERKRGGPFTDFIDFCKRVAAEDVNKKCIESMIKAGAFDSLGTNRNTLLCSFEKVLDMIASDHRKSLSGQISMFGDDMATDNLYSLEKKPELEAKKLLSFEKDMLGLYVSGHPLEAYRDAIKNYSNISSLDLVSESEDEESYQNNKLTDGQYVKLIGIISEVRKKITKSNEVMAFITLEDISGSIPVIAFARVYEGYKNLIFEDNIVKVEGRVNIKEDEITIAASKIMTCEEASFEKKNTLMIEIPQNLPEEKLKFLRAYLKNLGTPSANCDVVVKSGERQSKLRLEINEKTENELISFLGQENVKWE